MALVAEDELDPVVLEPLAVHALAEAEGRVEQVDRRLLKDARALAVLGRVWRSSTTASIPARSSSRPRTRPAGPAPTIPDLRRRHGTSCVPIHGRRRSGS